MVEKRRVQGGEMGRIGIEQQRGWKWGSGWECEGVGHL